MENPVLEIRKDLGIGRAQFSVLLGVSYGILSQTELGYPLTLPESVATGLERLGFDREQIEQEYRAWRSSLLKRQEAAAREALDALVAR
jgi:hypothetical protein